MIDCNNFLCDVDSLTCWKIRKNGRQCMGLSISDYLRVQLDKFCEIQHIKSTLRMLQCPKTLHKSNTKHLRFTQKKTSVKSFSEIQKFAKNSQPPL